MDERKSEPNLTPSADPPPAVVQPPEGPVAVSPEPLGQRGSILRIVGNVLWLILHGFWMAFLYALAGLVMFVTIIGIPFGIQAFKLAGFSLWPFGRMMVRKPSSGAGSFIGNVLWFIFAGLWLAIGHLFAALLFAITIIGIPFAIASVHLAEAALIPFGREVVSTYYGASRADPH